MLSTHWYYSAKAVVDYLSKADYFATAPGNLIGSGFDRLDISKMAPRDVLECIAHNLNPATGELLRPHAKEGDRVGVDFTFNCPKSVSLARELGGEDNSGDVRIEQAHREAVAYTMGLIETGMATRVRVGGANENRVTGNLFAYRVTHGDTRVNADDQMPDPHLHDHVFVANLTYDPLEKKFKAAEIGQVKHDAPYYEAIYMNRLASNLKALGYGIERKGKAFELAGVSEDLVKKFSRRTAYIEKVADKLGISSPKTKARLGATTRLGKAKERVDDLNGYYVSRLTGEEKRALAGLQCRAGFEGNEREAVEFAIGHLFERNSVVEERKLYELALRRGIGGVTLDGVRAEAHRQGLLTKDGEATTRQVLAEEQRVIGFARDGRGTCRPMGLEEPLIRYAGSGGRSLEAQPDGERPVGSPGRGDPGHGPLSLGDTVPHGAMGSGVDFDLATLSPDQQAICRHVWTSTDRVILIRGAAGTGKTHTMKATIAGLDRPVVVLAPSSEASRGVLRKEGFQDADTVARFLIDEKFQEKARGGVIWVDEAGLLGIRQVREVFDAAERLNARVVLQGDRKQHGSVERGATLRVLEEFAGLPVAELKDIRRQKGRYKQAVASLAKGDLVGGYDQLAALKWIKETDTNIPLVEDYLAALDSKKTVLVVAPTHAEGGEIAAEIRARLKERGTIAREGKQVGVLVPLHWTEAERGDLDRYEGPEVMQFHRNSGTFKAGDRVRVVDWKPGYRFAKAEHFSVYTPSAIELAAGDKIRITANGKTKDGKHKLNNGAVYPVKGFTRDDDIVLGNGWVVGRDFGHLAHGYVTTSHASQGKTVDRVLIAMGHESRPAMGAEQFYVSVSRGREQATIYSDLTPAELREAIQKADPRKSATELLRRAPAPAKPKRRSLAEKIRRAFQQLREKAEAGIAMQRERERSYARAR